MRATLRIWDHHTTRKAPSAATQAQNVTVLAIVAAVCQRAVDENQLTHG